MSTNTTITRFNVWGAHSQLLGIPAAQQTVLIDAETAEEAVSLHPRQHDYYDVRHGAGFISGLGWRDAWIQTFIRLESGEVLEITKDERTMLDGTRSKRCAPWDVVRTLRACHKLIRAGGEARADMVNSAARRCEQAGGYAWRDAQAGKLACLGGGERAERVMVVTSAFAEDDAELPSALERALTVMGIAYTLTDARSSDGTEYLGYKVLRVEDTEVGDHAMLVTGDGLLVISNREARECHEREVMARESLICALGELAANGEVDAHGYDDADTWAYWLSDELAELEAEGADVDAIRAWARQTAEITRAADHPHILDF